MFVPDLGNVFYILLGLLADNKNNSYTAIIQYISIDCFC